MWRYFEMLLNFSLYCDNSIIFHCTVFLNDFKSNKCISTPGRITWLPSATPGPFGPLVLQDPYKRASSWKPHSSNKCRTVLTEAVHEITRHQAEDVFHGLENRNERCITWEGAVLTSAPLSRTAFKTPQNRCAHDGYSCLLRCPSYQTLKRPEIYKHPVFIETPPNTPQNSLLGWNPKAPISQLGVHHETGLPPRESYNRQACHLGVNKMLSKRELFLLVCGIGFRLAWTLSCYFLK